MNHVMHVMHYEYDSYLSMRLHVSQLRWTQMGMMKVRTAWLIPRRRHTQSRSQLKTTSSCNKDAEDDSGSAFNGGITMLTPTLKPEGGQNRAVSSQGYIG